MNPFLSVLDLAARNRWCMRPFCTTCGASEFRTALRKVFAEDSTSLANALAALDLAALEGVPGWEGALRLALDELREAYLMDRVLTAWLPQLGRYIRLADVVLFYYVRRGALFAPMSLEVLQHWIAKCIGLAAQTRGESLVESLVYALGDRYKEHASLAVVVHALAGSQRIEHAVARQRSDAELRSRADRGSHSLARGCSPRR